MRSYFLFLAVMIMGACFTSCTKSSFSGDQTPTRIRMVNAMPNKSYDLALNTKGLFSNIPYDSITPFANGVAGFYQLAINEQGSSDFVVKGNQYLQAGKYYSLFMIPDSSGQYQEERLSVVADNHVVPLYDSAKVRFLHFSPNAPLINFVQVKERGSSGIYDTLFPLSRDRAYLDNGITSSVAQYITIHTGDYIFNFFNAEPPVKVEANPIRVTIGKGKFYTFYIEGIAGRTGSDALKSRVIVSGI